VSETGWCGLDTRQDLASFCRETREALPGAILAVRLPSPSSGRGEPKLLQRSAQRHTPRNSATKLPSLDKEGRPRLLWPKARGWSFYICPLFQGGRRVFCGRGSSLVLTTPPVVPLAKGDRTLAFGQSCRGHRPRQGGLNGGDKTKPVGGCSNSHHPRGPARHIPSLSEEGSSSPAHQFRDRN